LLACCSGKQITVERNAEWLFVLGKELKWFGKRMKGTGTCQWLDHSSFYFFYLTFFVCRCLFILSYLPSDTIKILLESKIDCLQSA